MTTFSSQQPITLTELSSSELSLEPIREGVLMLLQSDEIAPDTEATLRDARRQRDTRIPEIGRRLPPWAQLTRFTTRYDQNNPTPGSVL